MLRFIRLYLLKAKRFFSGTVRKVTTAMGGSATGGATRIANTGRWRRFVKTTAPYAGALGSSIVGAAIYRSLVGTGSSINQQMISESPQSYFTKKRRADARSLREHIDHLTRASDMAPDARRAHILGAIDSFYCFLENLPDDQDVNFAIAGLRLRDGLATAGLVTEEAFNSPLLVRYVANRKDDTPSVGEIEIRFLEALYLLSDATPLKSN